MALGSPRLSIVTVCRNAARTIGRTFASVQANKTDEVEYIVVDGGSTDGTLAIIEQHQGLIDKWISGADEGIYDAMNKGIAMAGGEFVCFLNADDWLQSDAIGLLVPLLDTEVDFVFGIALLLRPDGAVDGLFLPAVDKQGRLDDLIYRGTPIPHPALVCRTALAKDVGFKKGLLRAADYDFMIRLIQRARNYRYLPKILVNFELGGVSSLEGNSEIFRVQRQNFPFLLQWQLQTPQKKSTYYLHLTNTLKKVKNAEEATEIRALRGSLELGFLFKFLVAVRYLVKRLV